MSDSKRYTSQLQLNDFDTDSQARLARSHALIVGVGGLGCIAAQLLTIAGVGRLTLVDPDVVELENLHRQILFNEDQVGISKVAAAKERLQRLNSEVRVEAKQQNFIYQLIQDEEFGTPTIILDCADNPEATESSNLFSVMNSVPLITASVYRHEGRISFFNGQGQPCNSCLANSNLGATCEAAGTLGTVPNMMGALQADAALRYLSGYKPPHKNQLVIFDFETLSTSGFSIESDQRCTVCNSTVLESGAVSSYDTLKGRISMDINQMQPTELKAAVDAGEALQIVDVREQDEWDASNLESVGAKHVPMGDVLDRISELDPDAKTVVHCRSGGRSAKVVEALQEKGFADIYNLDGGIHRWIDDIDPSLTKV